MRHAGSGRARAALELRDGRAAMRRSRNSKVKNESFLIVALIIAVRK